MLKFLSEFGPIIAFLIGYKNGGIPGATIYMMTASVIGIILCYVIDRKIYTFSVVSCVIVLIAGGSTLISGNTMFIKIKPTILYLGLSLAIYLTAKKEKPVLKYVFNSAVPLKDENAWVILSYRFSWFFIFMGILNEIVWRNFDEAIWVKFKVFGVVPITMLFLLTQAPFFLKNRRN